MCRSRVLVVVVALCALSCGGTAPPPAAALSSTWKAPPILAQVPADTPYLFASLEPLSENLRQRIYAQFNRELVTLIERAQHISAEQVLEHTKDRSLEPWIRAGLAIARELDAKDAVHWDRQLGFDARAQIALYGLSVWPVLRIEVADPVRLRGVIQRAMTASGTSLPQATLEGRSYWITRAGVLTVIAAVLEHEAVVAMVPTPAVATALPLVLGTQAPAQRLVSTATIPELLARHHFDSHFAGYIDLQRVLDIFAGRRPTALDAPLHAMTGPFPAECTADLDRLVGLAPRVAMGYQRIDEVGFAGAAIFESAPPVTSALERLRAAAPEVATSAPEQAMFALGAAFNFDEAVALLRGVTAEIHQHPFSCPWLTDVNPEAASLATKLTRPVPPALSKLRGGSLVVDRVQIMPPSIDGHVMVSGGSVGDLFTYASILAPALAGVPVKRDGVPIELSAQQLGIPMMSRLHVAMTADRLVLAAGDDSARHASDALAVPVPRSSPLFTMAIDGPRLQQLLRSISATDPNLGSVGKVQMSLDVKDDGVGFEFSGTWSGHTLPPLPPPPPPSGAMPAAQP
jgi:uncharacterized protein (DUF1810 family)